MFTWQLISIPNVTLCTVKAQLYYVGNKKKCTFGGRGKSNLIISSDFVSKETPNYCTVKFTVKHCMNIKSKQFNGKMHSTMEIACYSTHTVDLKKQRQHTQPGSLKIPNQKPQRTSRKENPSKDNCFTFLGQCFTMWEALIPSSSYRWCLHIQQLDLYGWICQDNNSIPRTMSDKTLFLKNQKYFLQNSKPKCTV